jgi:peptidoglycan-associated lipoprotein
MTLSVLLSLSCAAASVRPEEPKPGPVSSTSGAAPDNAATAATSSPSDTSANEAEEASAAARKAGAAIVYFTYDSALLQPKARDQLSSIARQYEKTRAPAILLEGHADERGTAEYNLVLGQSRADAVRQYLIQLGLQSEGMKTRSFGEAHPADPTHGEAAYAKNRRVEVQPAITD